jgi:hypothetical protein
MTDFFDLSDDAFAKKNSNASNARTPDTNIYNPDPKAFNGKYQSVYRYVPYIFDKKLSKLTKYAGKFYNTLTKEVLYVDCPSNVGEPSIIWDVQTVVKSLKDEEPDLWKQLDESFGRWHNNYSPVYIKKDPQRPELEGQVKIIKYAAQLNNLIEDQIHPEANDLIEAAASVQPFHLLNGKDFLCVVGMKTRTFRDWSKCKFMDEVTPFMFKVGEQNVIVENSAESINLVTEFLKKNTPKLDEYMHKAWTPEIHEKVADAIIACIGNKAVIKMILDRTKDTVTKGLIEAKMNGTSAVSASASAPSQAASIDTGIEFKSEPAAVTPGAAITPDAAAPSDEYDSLFGDL